MSNAQFYLAVGLPSAIALIGILVNVGYFVALNGRMTRVENRIDQLSDRITGLQVETGVLKQGFDILMKKFDEVGH